MNARQDFKNILVTGRFSISPFGELLKILGSKSTKLWTRAKTICILNLYEIQIDAPETLRHQLCRIKKLLLHHRTRSGIVWGLRCGSLVNPIQPSISDSTFAMIQQPLKMDGQS
ncbi:uncharacterized protein PHALS_05639 [Plasmopara halstedii]|uniref:Uncharacterized protein n=1 Tax=Plasmopara halstedii TaxID=4781 RepID=A0A0P1B1T6_PLAHL|nr:uncharacterized protein PHALS_05639 [Plasmopara halstedii]CEG48169.1 hypothetical protein PHALS_05639 [Plasmopara halstedii]|eukprot:XP_024584538.1 hypothetical protein PHALS_05639 [Plasmopara halstedii]